MSSINSLLVIWQNKTNLLYYHVGTLSFDGNYYTFTYTHHENSHRTVQEALQNGYHLHPSFPILEKEYKSENLFPTFDRRIPSLEREDFKEIITDLGLPAHPDRMDILKATRGILSGDTYSFEQPLRMKNNVLQTHFYINGMRHRNLPGSWSSLIHVNEKLLLLPEPTNPKDSRAVRIETNSGLHLGYVPGFYAEAINSLIANKANITLTIREIRPDSSPQWWVSIEFSCDLSTLDTQIIKKANLGSIIEAA